MRNYSDNLYKKLSENTSEPTLRRQIDNEIGEILKVRNPQKKTFIDLGAGHGRVLPTISKIAQNVISIEINPEMLPELKSRTAKTNNSKIITGDITKLTKLLENEELNNPVLLLLQNSLGTIEGDWKVLLEEMKNTAKSNHGEIIMTFFRAEAIFDWGVKLYTNFAEMTGEPDIKKMKQMSGIFVSKTGYISKWWSEQEIKQIKKFLGGKLINEISTKEYCTIHIQYA